MIVLQTLLFTFHCVEFVFMAIIQTVIEITVWIMVICYSIQLACTANHLCVGVIDLYKIVDTFKASLCTIILSLTKAKS